MVELRDLLKTSFRELEIILFQDLAETFLQALKTVLEDLDKLLSNERDTERYICKDIRTREIETLFGTLEYKRRYYFDKETGTYVYLLDQVLEMEKKINVSPGLSELAVYQGVNGTSYRGARDQLERFYQRPVISHKTIRQRVLDPGRQLQTGRTGGRATGTDIIHRSRRYMGEPAKGYQEERRKAGCNQPRRLAETCRRWG